MFFVKYFSSYN